jgi:hypothetical protein
MKMRMAKNFLFFVIRFSHPCSGSFPLFSTGGAFLSPEYQLLDDTGWYRRRYRLVSKTLPAGIEDATGWY